ncbi:MAG: ComF family protein [Pseudohongiellaceae bacterium]
MDWLNMLRQGLPHLNHLLGRITVPSCCVFCSSVIYSRLALCNSCRADLPWHEPGCRRCGLKLPVGISNVLTECLQCQEHPPPFYSCQTVFEYRSPVRELLAHFKFNGDLSSGTVFGRLLAEKFASYYRESERPQLLIPVPLHAKRIRERGFNQATELARLITHRTGVRCTFSEFERRRHTRAQHTLNARQRRANLADAFALKKPFAEGMPAHVAIIDDVVTTGTTVGVMAELVTSLGAKRVDIWAVARAEK